MKRSCMAILATVFALAAAVPAAAAAAVVELGGTKTQLAAPTCPPGVAAAACRIVLTQVTALETIRDGIAYPTRVTKAGRIVAFTLGVSRLDKNDAKARADIHFLDAKYRNPTYGGNTQAALVVLKPVGAHKFFRWRVSAISPMYHLQPYLGQVVQFPLITTLPVSPGDVIGLSVPTWAPVLSFDLLPRKFAYRQSRKGNCVNPAITIQAQLTIGATASYLCNYPGTRVEYSATEVTDPVPPKNQIHTVRKP